MLRRACWLVVLAVPCVIGGCASPRSARGIENPPPGAAQRVTDLQGSLEAVREDFNAHAGEWRAVLLGSPTCSECVLGARAVEREIMQRYPAETVHACVVWERMLGEDDRSAAGESSGYLPRANATHFYDGARVSGWAYRDGPFAGMGPRAKAALPAGHWLLEIWDRGREGPEWDLYMLYSPGVRWEAAVPTPTAWIRHVGRIGGGASLYWRDTPDKPPRNGDLFDGMRAMADETIGGADASVGRIGGQRDGGSSLGEEAR